MAANYDLVIFDLDGTLVDSAPDLCTALRLTLTDLGLRPHDLPAVRSMIGEGQRVLVERALTRAGGDPGLVDQVLPRFRAHYDAHLIEQTVLYPGVAQALTQLAAEVPLAVATNKPGHWARRIVDALGIAAAFRWVLGEDDVGRRKPDPLLLTEIAARAQAPLARVLFVGDSAIDRATAQAAGVDMVLCTWGYGDAATLAPLPPPKRTIDAFADIVPCVLG